jgi:hypothetical protein
MIPKQRLRAIELMKPMDEARSHMKSRYNMVDEIDGCQVWSMNHEREAWIGQQDVWINCEACVWIMGIMLSMKCHMKYGFWELWYIIFVYVYMGVGSIDCKTEDLTMTSPIPSHPSIHVIPFHLIHHCYIPRPGSRDTIHFIFRITLHEQIIHLNSSAISPTRYYTSYPSSIPLYVMTQTDTNIIKNNNPFHMYCHEQIPTSLYSIKHARY